MNLQNNSKSTNWQIIRRNQFSCVAKATASLSLLSFPKFSIGNRPLSNYDGSSDRYRIKTFGYDNNGGSECKESSLAAWQKPRANRNRQQPPDNKQQRPDNKQQRPDNKQQRPNNKSQTTDSL